jgi:hypothetical protein
MSPTRGGLLRNIGLDVHRDFCEVAIAEAGVVRSTGRIATTPEKLELFAARVASIYRCKSRAVQVPRC